MCGGSLKVGGLMFFKESAKIHGLAGTQSKNRRASGHERLQAVRRSLGDALALRVDGQVILQNRAVLIAHFGAESEVFLKHLRLRLFLACFLFLNSPGFMSNIRPRAPFPSAKKNDFKLIDISKQSWSRKTKRI